MKKTTMKSKYHKEPWYKDFRKWLLKAYPHAKYDPEQFTQAEYHKQAWEAAYNLYVDELQKHHGVNFKFYESPKYGMASMDLSKRKPKDYDFSKVLDYPNADLVIDQSKHKPKKLLGVEIILKE